MKKIAKCYFCNGGLVIKGKTDHISRMSGQLVEIKDVPCEICQHCGEKYFDPKTVRRLEQIVRLKAKVKEYIQLPVYIDLCKTNKNAKETTVIARRAKPDEAIPQRLLRFLPAGRQALAMTKLFLLLMQSSIVTHKATLTVACRKS